MIKHDQILEMLPAYALGCLDEEEALLVSEHLGICAQCNGQFLEYRSTVGTMAFGTPRIRPPDSLKQKLMHRIQSKAKEPSPARSISKPWKWKSLLPNFTPAWAFASLALILSLSVFNLIQWQNAQSLRDEFSVELLVLKMRGTHRAPKGDGTFVISQNRKKGVLVASDLPVPDKSKQYQLWMKKNGQQVSGGVFSVTPTGYAVVEIQSKELLSDFKNFEVTLEPAGGSQSQTGQLYMVSHL